MVKKRINKQQPIIRNPNFMKFYVTNIRGGLTDADFRFELLNEQIQDEKEKWCYVSDALIILSAKGAKRLYERLKKCIEIYEKEHGIIETKETRKKTF